MCFIYIFKILICKSPLKREYFMSKPTNYQVKKYGPITSRRDYSNTKVELETQDFLQMQKDSFE
jgi:hypothetical protein